MHHCGPRTAMVSAGILPPPGGGVVRQDVFLENDAGGFAVLSSEAVPRAVEDGRQDDLGFVRRHEAVLCALVGDDSFIARVVVGEPLTPAEEAEWFTRIRWRLKVPCGRLVIGAGFDPDCLAEWNEERVADATEDEDSATVRSIEVPAGEYLVDVLGYLHTMNGRVLIEQAWGEKLGPWFRRDHPGKPFPGWVAGELARSPEDDPGHEEEWRTLGAAVAAKKLQVDTSQLDWIGFLIHLRPLGPGAELSALPEDAWFAPEEGLRRPATCPLGIPADGARDPEYRYELKELLPARKR